MKTKTCSKCKKEQSIDDFYKKGKSLQAWCKDCKKQYDKVNYKRNKSKIQHKNKTWSAENSDYNSKRNKQWLENNKERRKKYKKKYREENREKINQYKREKYHEKMKDPMYRLEQNLRGRLRKSVKKIKLNTNSYSESSKDLIGCSLQDLKKHLESKFKKGMNWDNYGKWHVGHIIPVAEFDLTKEKQIEECFNYKNLQPLWAIENIRKGANF